MQLELNFNKTLRVHMYYVQLMLTTYILYLIMNTRISLYAYIGRKSATIKSELYIYMYINICFFACQKEKKSHVFSITRLNIGSW